MNEQIEEMATALKFCRNTTIEECRTKVDCKHCIAEQIYNAGYRRQDEVAREIFVEIDKIAYRYLNDADYSGGDMVYDLNELKKKYGVTEDESES